MSLRSVQERFGDGLDFGLTGWIVFPMQALVRSIAKLLDVDGERHDLYVIGLQEAHNSVAESVIAEALGEKYRYGLRNYYYILTSLSSSSSASFN